MWRDINPHTHFQTEGQLYPRHWSIVEQANIERIGFQNGEIDLQQSNVPGVNVFPNGLQPVPPVNGTFYAQVSAQQMAQISPSIASNFGSQIANHAFSSVFNESAMKGIKRKGEDDYNPYFPFPKQHITDERMAAGMNNLYITNDHNYCSTSMFDPDDNLNMEFNDLPSSNESVCCQITLPRLDDSCDAEKNDKKAMFALKRDHPVFQFCAPLEQFLRRKSDILPAKIIEEIYKPCLAVVPWIPPLNTEENLRKEKKKVHGESSKATEDGNEDEEMSSS